MRLLRPALVMAAAAVTAAVLISGAAAAVETEDGATVGTDPVGAHVELRHRDTWVEVESGSGPAPTTGCLRRWIRSSGSFALRETRSGDYRQVPMPPAPGPEYVAYHVWCGDGYVDTVWLRPEQFGVDPRVVAEDLVHDLPYPAARVGSSPSGRGLTGLETWFWVDGYTGAPIVDTVSELGMTVTVEARVDTVAWDFGDGTTGNGLGPGTPPPSRSPVAHVFETRARPAYRVRALVSLAVRWRLGDGPWQDLAPVVRTAVADYPVVASRAALVPDDGPIPGEAAR
jgi:hypothetical protein